jgi:uncharacterized membrane protein YgaE (UPF0421/DUF939 family)
MSTLAETYYQRDISMNLDKKTQIINSLKKLGYINFNYDNKINNYINHQLSKIMLDNNYFHDKTIDYYIDNIKNTNEYIKYSNYLEQCIEKSKIFNQFLLYNNYDNDILRNFYNICTEEELYYLGY